MPILNQQPLLHQDPVVDRRGGRKHSTEQKGVRMDRHESSLRRQREQEMKGQTELNAKLMADPSNKEPMMINGQSKERLPISNPRQKHGRATQNLNQSAQENPQSKSKYYQQPEARANNSFGNHNAGSNSRHHQGYQATANFPPAVEEPICVLKIELDGEHVEEIKVFRTDEPFELVQQFGKQFNLSDNAKQRLFEQIQEQIQAEESERDWAKNVEWNEKDSILLRKQTKVKLKT